MSGQGFACVQGRLLRQAGYGNNGIQSTIVTLQITTLGPGKQPYHTHLEFNSGRYCPENKERWDFGNSVARPMSQDANGKNILLGEISEGCNFSNNPYDRYIIPIWEERGGSNV